MAQVIMLRHLCLSGLGWCRMSWTAGHARNSYLQSVKPCSSSVYSVLSQDRNKPSVPLPRPRSSFSQVFFKDLCLDKVNLLGSWKKNNSVFPDRKYSLIVSPCKFLFLSPLAISSATSGGAALLPFLSRVRESLPLWEQLPPIRGGRQELDQGLRPDVARAHRSVLVFTISLALP